MKKKISLKDYTKKAEALKMIEIDSVAAEIYGKFEAYFIEHNHAEKISKMIVEAASNGRTSISFSWQELDIWFDKDFSMHTKNPINKERYLNSITLKKVTVWSYRGIHISYGKFLICKMAEQLANAFEGEIVICDKLPRYSGVEECYLTFDWSDEKCHSKRVYIRDFFPGTILLNNMYDWDDWALNIMMIVFLIIGSVLVNLLIGLIFVLISEKVADIVFLILFIPEIAINFIARFKSKKNLFYEGNVFND